MAAIRADGVPEALSEVVPLVFYQAAVPDWALTYVGGSIKAILGFDEREFTRDTWNRFIHADDRETTLAHMDEALKHGGPFQMTYRFWTRDRDRLLWIIDRGTFRRNAAGQPASLIGAMLDVTEHRRVRGELSATLLRYRALFQGSPLPMWIVDRETLRFMEVNEAAIARYGYSLEQFRAMTLLDIRPPEEHAALRDAIDNSTEKLHESGIWRHILSNGEIVQVMVTSQRFRHQGRNAELVMVRDVTGQLQAEAQARKAAADVKDALEGTINVLAQATEQRDPYTAGHQRRVAVLAEAIGRKTGLSLDQLEGLRLASLVHDVGKIAVPADILAAPRKLRDAEHGMVQGHVDAGYQLLSKVKFPWPVARIVREHHERLDGSGYPEGLKAPAILPEAKVLMVADVAEAMLTHRPYRAALPVAEMLKELRKGHGKRYDADVVDACTELFIKDGFNLPGPGLERRQGT